MGGVGVVIVVKEYPIVNTVKTKQDLLAAIDRVGEALVEHVSNWPEDFLTSKAEPIGWTMAKNIKHVAFTNSLIAHWLKIPRFFLKLLGSVKKPDAKIEDLRPTNRPLNFDYGVYRTAAKVQSGLKEKRLHKLKDSFAKLRKAVESCSDEDLVKYKAPVGGADMTMAILFTLKHAVHHLQVAEGRLEES